MTIRRPTANFIPQSACRSLPKSPSAVRRLHAEIARRQRAEVALREMEARYALALRGSQDGLWDWDLRVGSIYFSPRWKAIIGYDDQEFPNTVEAFAAHIHPQDNPPVFELIRDYLAGRADSYDIEFRMCHKDGSYRWIQARGAMQRDSDGRPCRLAGSHADVTDRKWFQDQVELQITHVNDAYVELEVQRVELATANAKLHQANTLLRAQATTDGLTGLKNHRAFQEQLAAEFARCHRYHSTLSLVLLDVDNFKQFNDTFGHPAGDQVLIKVASLLQSAARGADFVARYGGEEFVVILPETDSRGAREAAERFRQRIETAYWPDRPVTASLGVASMTTEMQAATHLIADADHALYQAKQRGRNCVSCSGDAEDRLVLSAEEAPTCSNTVKLEEALQRAYDATIEGWSHILDLRDKETEGHSERVTAMTLQLAHRLGLRDAQLAHLRWGALLHDIGKMGIPDSILHKPGPLSNAEWDIMRTHPVLALEMLAPISFLRPALDIPYCHHEKWNGSGYPRGLAGTEIPLSARLFAVVDVWDALRSDRPYRKGWPERKVHAYLCAQAGQHFEPEIVLTFLNILSEQKGKTASRRTPKAA